ncbi:MULTISPECIES: hypothetical protein [Peptoniphilus]|jgi:hypothetical protein|uniref:DUF1659 domain-containing protein n=1 Tax=Peptoniphilus TaxID=162289 RepID=UPI0002887A97|nr:MULTISPECIES: hypothetical protein [Peptoniphilus]MBS6610356.1 hypothetical protein [Peptoniphilus harei]MDU1043614.1 hypothetical protein [Peptoniphilus rhinitidis]MDU1954557.1 hypothetical protein [Peptoniphilus lacydonensis]MDU2110205.1 hypothetical protein [Peptoniphilus lacydonensis]MDU2115400.1 hypothetical protein [Peptoniphilus lacydonensis]
MAVKTLETKCKLRTVVSDDSTGKVKRRSITVRDISPNANNENLLKLSIDLKKLVEGDLAGTVKVVEESLAEEA